MLKFTEQELIADAARFNSRMDWKCNSPSIYALVHRRFPHIKSKCVQHMGPAGKPFGYGYSVYVYRFSDNSVYIGLTCMLTRRQASHKCNMLRNKEKLGIQWTFEVVASNLTQMEAVSTEREIIRTEKTQGHLLLNRSGGGELGGINKLPFYEFEDIVAKLRGCRSRTEAIRTYPKLVGFVYRVGRIDELYSRLGWTRYSPKHTKDTCLVSASRFKHSSDWKANDRVAFNTSLKHGWLAEIKKKCGFTKKLKPKATEFEVSDTLGNSAFVRAANYSRAKGAAMKYWRGIGIESSYEHLKVRRK